MAKEEVCCFLLLLVAFLSHLTGVVVAFIPPNKQQYTGRVCCSVRVALHFQQENKKLFQPSVYDTIQSGRIAVIPDFLPPSEVATLRSDAASLHAENYFSTDALAGYGSTTGKATFDPSRDRAVLKLDKWKSDTIGDTKARRGLGDRMAAVRSDLAYHLNRPHLDQGLATTKYGYGSTEISYTRFGPGAFLKRHTDEHHEELKGTAGWSQPTRRSISWLIYLNENWKSSHGGQLRCFERTVGPSSQVEVGARPNGDLQIAWLTATTLDPVERPVFLDGRQEDGGRCAMYIIMTEKNGDRKKQYITPQFDAHPILYTAGSEFMVRKLLVFDQRDIAERLHLIEPVKSKLGDILTADKKYRGTGLEPGPGEMLQEVEPTGGTLVLFDSVALPHEVLATRSRERWASSGWFHEDQQQPILSY